MERMPLSEKSRILITGASGVLGTELCRILDKRNIPYTGAGRSESSRQNWVSIDLKTGKNLSEAVKDKDIVFHLASDTKNFSRESDVDGTEKLCTAALNAGVRHFIYISIVGIDRVPYKYYEVKLEAEKKIINSGLQYSILRAVQFHDFLDMLLQKLMKFPIAVLPGSLKFQPIETSSVAGELLRIAENSPLNSVRNLGGKEILLLSEIMELWLKAQGRKRLVIPVPALGRMMKSLASGGLTCTEKSENSITWSEWVMRKYSQGK